MRQSFCFFAAVLYFISVNVYVDSQYEMGYMWEVKEAEFSGVWVRRGESNIFDAEYSNRLGKRLATVNEVSIEGNKVRAKRIYSSDGIFCSYEGTLNDSGLIVQGFLTCPFNESKAMWEANIFTTKKNIYLLEGIWTCDDRGTYYVRQAGDTIVWYGEQKKDAPEWSNIAYGIISNDTLYMQWYDVPKGTLLGKGELILKIISKDKFERINKNTDFGGVLWERAGVKAKK